MTQPANNSTRPKMSDSEKALAFFMGTFLTYYCYKIAMFFSGSACEKKGSTDSGQKMRIVGVLLVILLVKGHERFNIDNEGDQSKPAGNVSEKGVEHLGGDKKSKKSSKKSSLRRPRKGKKNSEVRGLVPVVVEEGVDALCNNDFLKSKLKPSLMKLFFCFNSSVVFLGFFVGSWASGIDDFSLMISELAFSFCFSCTLSFLGGDGVFLASFPQAFFGTFYFFSALVEGVVLESAHLFSAVFAFCACQYIRVSVAFDRQEEKDRAENIFFATSCMTFLLSLSAKENRSIAYEVQRTSVFLMIFSFLGQSLLLGGDKKTGLSRPDKSRGDKDVWAPWRVFLGEVKKAFIKRKLSFMAACFLTYVVFSLNVDDLKKYQGEFSEVIAEGLQESYVYAILTLSCLSCLVFYRRDSLLKAFEHGRKSLFEKKERVTQNVTKRDAAKNRGGSNNTSAPRISVNKKRVLGAREKESLAQARAASQASTKLAQAKKSLARAQIAKAEAAAAAAAAEKAKAAAKAEAAQELALEPATATAPELEPEPELALEPAQAAVVQARIVKGEAIEPEASQGPANGVVVAKRVYPTVCESKGLAVFQTVLKCKMDELEREAGRLSLDMNATGQQLSRFKQKGSCYGKSSDLSPAQLQVALDCFFKEVFRRFIVEKEKDGFKFRIKGSRIIENAVRRSSKDEEKIKNTMRDSVVSFALTGSDAMPDFYQQMPFKKVKESACEFSDLDLVIVCGENDLTSFFNEIKDFIKERRWCFYCEEFSNHNSSDSSWVTSFKVFYEENLIMDITCCKEMSAAAESSSVRFVGNTEIKKVYEYKELFKPFFEETIGKMAKYDGVRGFDLFRKDIAFLIKHIARVRDKDLFNELCSELSSGIRKIYKHNIRSASTQSTLFCLDLHLFCAISLDARLENFSEAVSLQIGNNEKKLKLSETRREVRMFRWVLGLSENGLFRVHSVMRNPSDGAAAVVDKGVATKP